MATHCSIAASDAGASANRTTESLRMLMPVLLQIVSVLVAALMALLVSGASSAGFLALGGAAAIIPNSLFALRLAVQRNRSAASFTVTFLVGEFLKIGITVGLLFAIHRWLGPVAWLPLLIGLIVALKAPLFAVLLMRERTLPSVPH